MRKNYILTCLYHSRDATYPLDMHKENVNRFSTIVDAEEEIRRLLLTFDFKINMEVFRWELSWDFKTTCSRGSKIFNWGRRYYNAKGEFLYTEDNAEPTAFSGRTPQDCRFQVGEVVQFYICGGHIEVGIVASLPLSPARVLEIRANLNRKGIRSVWPDTTDDTYVILYGVEEEKHSHEPEALLSPVSSSLPQEMEALEKRLKKLAANSSIEAQPAI